MEPRVRHRAVTVRPVVRIGAALLGLAAIVVGYRGWTPGRDVTDGRHDRGRNGIWLQHGWLGSDDWFRRHHTRARLDEFRDPANIRRLASVLRAQHITDVFADVSPADRNGDLPAVDYVQTERFLDAFAGFRVMPWTGGVVGKTCRIHDARWRRYFVQSIVELLVQHPRFAGVHIDIEPCESGNQDFLQLLDGLRQALPGRWLLSVAAFPPPLWWQPLPEGRCDAGYFRAVARRADQLAVLLYDTGLPWPRVYQYVVRRWTRDVLSYSEHAAVLLGVPASGRGGNRRPQVESLANALRGIHAGLGADATLPDRYQGVAIHGEWDMGAAEWDDWHRHFTRAPAANRRAR